MQIKFSINDLVPSQLAVLLVSVDFMNAKLINSEADFLAKRVFVIALAIKDFYFTTTCWENEIKGGPCFASQAQSKGESHFLVKVKTGEF